MGHEYIERVTCDVCGTERTFEDDKAPTGFIKVNGRTDAGRYIDADACDAECAKEAVDIVVQRVAAENAKDAAEDASSVVTQVIG